MAFLSQSDAFRRKRDPVYRASAVFHHRPGTTYSILDYWRLKRGLAVELKATLRDMAGNTQAVARLGFDEAPVLNYRPEIACEGSVEFEAFCAFDLVIPYAAIAAIFATPHSLSILHSYARRYAEGERGIEEGEESGWTLRDREGIRSFAVFHNGSHPQQPQIATLSILNARGEGQPVEVPLPALAPHATVRLFPGDYFSGLAAYLAGQPGHASLSFRIQSAFPRMLVGNETTDGKELSCTHSNFDYTKHHTDTLTSGGGLFRLPRLGGRRRDVFVYPTSTPGAYRAASAQSFRDFSSGTFLRWENAQGDLSFSRLDGEFPSRLVTALVLPTRRRLPVEMSSGVLHAAFERKRFWWAVAHANGKLVVTVANSVFGPVPAGAGLSVRLYSSATQRCLECKLGRDALASLEEGVPTRELFPEAERFLQGDYGYWVLSSEYPGLFVFSWLENEAGDFGYEHSF